MEDQFADRALLLQLCDFVVVDEAVFMHRAMQRNRADAEGGDVGTFVPDR